VTGLTELWLVRHGESTANVAASRADRDGDEVIHVDHRDPDVPLSETGEAQARALGRWFASRSDVPTAVWSSHYLRARSTAALALEEAGIDAGVTQDERLRDRELGILDLLTSRGVAARHPDEAERRRWLGKLSYRPPGGESWADVALRIRSFLQDPEVEAADGRALVTTHDAVVMLFLYVGLGLTEAELLDFQSTHTVANASVTILERSAPRGPWTLRTFSATEHLDGQGAPVTEHGGEPDDRGR
jgi:broad specificity phosphatase PhoE